MTEHKQTWIKVNAPVDEGIAEIVSILSGIGDLETVDSCQGIPGQAKAYVYFRYGDWQQVCDLLFSRIGPRAFSALYMRLMDLSIPGPPNVYKFF